MKTLVSKLKVGQIIKIRMFDPEPQFHQITRISPDPTRKGWVKVEFDCAMSCSLPETQMVTTKLRLTVGGKSV